MKLFIKEYLTELPLIKQLGEIVSAYSEEYGDRDAKDSFSDYKYNKNLDPITRFLNYSLPSDKTWRGRNPIPNEIVNSLTQEEIEEYKNNYYDDLKKVHTLYLVRLFSSVKGTRKVLDYILAYDLFLTTEGKNTHGPDTKTVIEYDRKSLSIEIERLPDTVDPNVFCSYLEEFLSNLLYFDKLSIVVKSVSMVVSKEIRTTVNVGIEPFLTFEENGDNPE